MNLNEKGIDIASIPTTKVNKDTEIIPNNKELILPANEFMQNCYKATPPVSIDGTRLRTGEVTFFFGSTGAGKSITVMDLAIRNAHKLSGNVLAIDAENKSHQISERYPEGFKFPPNFLMMDMTIFLANTDGVLTEDLILDIIKLHNIQLLIVDNLGFISPEAVQDQKASHRLIKMFWSVVVKSQISLLIVAHTPKRENDKPLEIKDLEGSAKISNYADSIVAVGRDSNGTRYLRTLKTRSQFDPNEVELFDIVRLANGRIGIEVTNVCDIDELFPKSEAVHNRGVRPSIDYESIAIKIFECKPSLRHFELKKELIDTLELSESNAKFYINQMIKQNLIVKDGEKYILNLNQILKVS